MFAKAEFKNLMVIDVETVSVEKDLATLKENDPRMAALWSKRCEYLRRRHADNSDLSDDEIYKNKAALQAEFGKIIVISVGNIRYGEDNQPTIKIRTFKGHDERALLQEFETLVRTVENKMPDAKWAGHNVKRFDIPFIGKRMLVNKISLPSTLRFRDKKPWESPFIDTGELWSFGSWQEGFTSLDVLTGALGIPSPKSDIDGSQVGTTYYNEDGLDRIAKYCENDVTATANIMLEVSQLDIIGAENMVLTD